jgi:formylglycine-generating enzyme required for sulfatase activity
VNRHGATNDIYRQGTKDAKPIFDSVLCPGAVIGRGSAVGGSWQSGDTSARSSYRNSTDPTQTNPNFGFRVVLAI